MVEMMMMFIYYICERLKLEGETENMGVCTKERKGVTAAVLMATPCTDGWRTNLILRAKTVLILQRGGTGEE